MNIPGGGLVTKSCPTLGTSWTVACQAPLSMGFSRQEYWSGLPFPFPGDLPSPGIKPGSSALQADPLLTELHKVCLICMRCGENFVLLLRLKGGKNRGGDRKRLEVKKRKKVCTL